MEQDRVFARVWVVGAGVPRSLAEHLAASGSEVHVVPPAGAVTLPADGDLVVLAPDASPFVLCTRLKAKAARRVAVAILCRDGDREIVEPIARFCMADGVVSLDEIEAGGAESALAELRGTFRRPRLMQSVDSLLARAEQRLGDDAGALADRVRSGLSREREQTFLAAVTDGETGLFTGPFMAFKLEEEFKRSWRFRTPLAVLLLDLPSMRDLGEARGQVLAEVAGVFLNECRDIDVLGRYDETSFLLLLPNTGAQGARVLATRVLDRMVEIASPVQLDPAVAIVTVPRTGIERKDELLDLARLTLVAAWAADGHDRVQLAP